jgi:FAD synthase
VQEDAPLSASQIRDLVRNECVELINELLGSRDMTQQKVVVLQSGSLKAEKVKEPSPLPERKDVR